MITEGSYRITVDVPPWMVAALDALAARAGSTRSEVIRAMIAKVCRKPWRSKDDRLQRRERMDGQPMKPTARRDLRGYS